MSSSSVLNLNSLPAAQGSRIGAAISEVAVAFQHLASAVLRIGFAQADAPKPMSAYEEAEALRSYAADIQQQDPDFALDLFAAADRHEIAAANALPNATA